MRVEVIVFAWRGHLDGSIMVADCDVQEFHLVLADAFSVVVFQDVIQEGNGFNQDDVLVLHRLVIN